MIIKTLGLLIMKMVLIKGHQLLTQHNYTRFVTSTPYKLSVVTLKMCVAHELFVINKCRSRMICSQLVLLASSLLFMSLLKFTKSCTLKKLTSLG